jgi:outer membrane protein assembly factor BamD
MKRVVVHRSALGVLLSVLFVLFTSACSGDQGRIPTGTLEPDKLLFDRGTTALNDRKWATAREYFRQIVDGYPQSPFRADSKIGVGDTYLGEGGAANAVLAAAEFKEFLSFYPTHPRADYAQYKLAMAHYSQMARPERDQSETKEAIAEFEAFFERFPNSELTPEVRQKYRDARDRLSESEYRVGLFYYRSRWWPGAADRFRTVLKNDPEFTSRDAVYFYLAETLRSAGPSNHAEALAYYERLMTEFEQSEYLEDARKRILELKPSAPQ